MKCTQEEAASKLCPLSIASGNGQVLCETSDCMAWAWDIGGGESVASLGHCGLVMSVGTNKTQAIY